MEQKPHTYAVCEGSKLTNEIKLYLKGENDMHIDDMNKEVEWYDKLAQTYLYFNYRELYSWSFEDYVDFVKRGVLQDILGIN